LRPLILAATVVALLTGCARDHTNVRPEAAAETPVAAKETFALGFMVTPAGAVPQDAASETFSRGGDIFLSIDVRSAGTGQTINVEWLDGQGRVVRRESRNVPEGSHYAAFSAGREIAAMPGAHRAVIIIDGRRVMEKPFSIL
jgi:hypothetical protein